MYKSIFLICIKVKLRDIWINLAVMKIKILIASYKIITSLLKAFVYYHIIL